MRIQVRDIAEATTEVGAARLLIRRTVREIERAGEARIEPVPRALVELVARDCHFAALYALRATDRLFRGAGSHVLFEGDEFQRCLRDIHAVASRTTRRVPSPVPPARPRCRLGRCKCDGARDDDGDF